ncbi:hypothetical protein Pla52o_54300 [Novipirellula galeiformis]|uniref:Uncharacterized protein n=1 Tax=Novipirellula galeiformis TaxID=2528004 RepID=A0A5C6BXR6_9BACT|nr:hypothetical protein [Novipirellula galeiformis]TWU17093.1 hypothetical protein Pla52o_54300 [Novipirellula galeiformis]
MTSFLWPIGTILRVAFYPLLLLGVSVGDAAEAIQDTGDAPAAIAETPQANATVPVKPVAAANATPSSTAAASKLSDASEVEETPWDFSPYKVLVWVVSSDPDVDAKTIREPLQTFLDRDFSAIWRMDVANAPPAVANAAQRNLDAMTFESITASDPVVAVKRDHADAVRLRVAANVGEIIKDVYATPGRIEEVQRRAAEIGNESIEGIQAKLRSVDGDAIAVSKKWEDPATEALLVSRGMALLLEKPEAKIITMPLSGLVIEAIDSYDKIFVVRVEKKVAPFKVSVVELDTLMRHFGPVATQSFLETSEMPVAIGGAMVQAFAPVLRIENAGQKNAEGRLRAGGLILDDTSPAMIHVGDVLEPMTRKNDRNGNPIQIGPIDWAYLLVTEQEGPIMKMDFHAGRAGGLQGRSNKRTFRMALRVRSFGKSTLLRLHAQKDPDFPLIGYEIYDRNLESGEMAFVGRTDWNGRLTIDATDSPLHLLYVKNGGAVLARLPIVPGFKPRVVADLSGDDMRLQAEAYIRGVQNAIIDLVAIRELLAARVRLRLRNGEMDEARDLLFALREQPTHERISEDMDKKLTAFLNDPGAKNPNQRRKIDEMFSQTQDLLSKQITPAKVRALEEDVIAATKNGGRLPPEKKDDDTVSAVDTTKASK